jgi:Flp pilus assembly pilin Flp
VRRFGLAVGRESAQATAEYALLLALVAAGLLVALLLFGTTIGQSYGRVSNRVNDPGGAKETGAASGGRATDLPGSAKGGDQGAGGKDPGCGGGKGGGYGQGGGSGCGGGKDH